MVVQVEVGDLVAALFLEQRIKGFFQSEVT
jgi:hypothetical protein